MAAAEDLKARICERPKPPRTIAETGIPLSNLLSLLLKTMYMQGLDRSSQVSAAMKLNTAIVTTLLEELKANALVENLGLAGQHPHSEYRFALTSKGREWATEALAQSQYVGPAPVSLEDFQRQVERQQLKLEQINPERLMAGLADLVIPDVLVRRLGPAINSERSILLYGPPGNGKTSVAEVIGHLFTQIIHVPHCIEVDGTIIKLFDPTLHRAVEDPDDNQVRASVRIEDIDRRWVACYRPIIMTGGELTLEMLDLSFNPYSRYYEAPLHMKAIGGTFVIDDLGRQLVRPEDLLNRWITPMEKRVDFLTLNTGKTFSIPFDELLVFSTNLTPDDIMDPAFLRRIPYKVELKEPSIDDYKTLFKRLCEEYGLPYDDKMPEFVANELQTVYDQPLSFYQPKFIVEQCVAACKYLDRPLEMNEDLLVDAMQNLSAKTEEELKGKGVRPNGNGGMRQTHARGVNPNAASVIK